MKNYIPVYPILPTSEASTLSFVQKLAVLEYRLEKLDERVAALETEIPDIPNISITNGEDDRIEKITLNNVDYYPDEVIIEGTGSSLTAVTVNGETLNVPQASGALTGTAVLTAGGETGKMRYERVDDLLFITITMPPAALSSNTAIVSMLTLDDVPNSSDFDVEFVSGGASGVAVVSGTLAKDMGGTLRLTLDTLAYANGTVSDDPSFAIAGLVMQYKTAVVNLAAAM